MPPGNGLLKQVNEGAVAEASETTCRVSLAHHDTKNSTHLCAKDLGSALCRYNGVGQVELQAILTPRGQLYGDTDLHTQ